MSLDERLRDAFGVDDGWMPQTSLAEVRAEASRRTRQRWTAVAAAAVLAAGVGVAVTVGGDDPSPYPAPPAPTTTDTPGTGVDGRWSSAPLTRAQVRSTLAAAGLASWVDELEEDVPTSRDTRVELLAEDGSLHVWLARPGWPEVLVDREDYDVDGRQLVLTPLGTTGSSRYTWRVDGDELRLTFVSTTEPRNRRVPAEVYQRAIYTAVPFTRE